MTGALAVIGALLMAVQSAAPVEPSPEEVVIIGERMRRLKLSTKTDRKTGVTRCVIKRSSGDQGFDAAICQGTLSCGAWVRTVPQMNACLKPHVERAVRDKRH